MNILGVFIDMGMAIEFKKKILPNCFSKFFKSFGYNMPNSPLAWHKQRAYTAGEFGKVLKWSPEFQVQIKAFYSNSSTFYTQIK